MTELVQYAAPQQVSRDVVDGWAMMLTKTAELAREIAATEFVPKALRGNAAATTACILAGRELGLGPMASLQNLFVIDGTPALRAQMMRALVLAHGHSYRIAEWNTQRCVMYGTRAGSNQEQGPAEFTMDDARRAHLDRKPNWVTYPSDMLLARCTGKLCRAVFPDALAGMSYTAEELADMTPGEQAWVDGQQLREQPEPSTTVQREQRPTEEQPQVGGQPGQLVTQPAVPGDEVELPGDDEPQPERLRSSETTRQAAIARARAERSQPALPAQEEPERQQQPTDPAGPASREQGGMIHGQLRQLYPEGLPRDDRLAIVQGLLSRRIESFSELSAREASQLIDTLAMVLDSSDPVAWLEHLAAEGLRALDLVEGGTQTADAELVEGPWGNGEDDDE